MKTTEIVLEDLISSTFIGESPELLIVNPIPNGDCLEFEILNNFDKVYTVVLSYGNNVYGLLTKQGKGSIQIPSIYNKRKDWHSYLIVDDKVSSFSSFKLEINDFEFLSPQIKYATSHGVVDRIGFTHVRLFERDSHSNFSFANNFEDVAIIVDFNDLEEVLELDFEIYKPDKTLYYNAKIPSYLMGYRLPIKDTIVGSTFGAWGVEVKYQGKVLCSSKFSIVGHITNQVTSTKTVESFDIKIVS